MCVFYIARADNIVRIKNWLFVSLNYFSFLSETHEVPVGYFLFLLETHEVH